MCTLTEVARRYHRDVGTLNAAVRRVQLRVNSSRAFREQYNKLLESVNTITKYLSPTRSQQTQTTR